MENHTQDPGAKKLEKLVQEIGRLEKDIFAVKDKSCTLENEKRLEIYQKNFLEVRKDDLTRSIEFYQNYSKKINTELKERQAVHLKLSMRSKYYDKLLEMYREKHLQLKKYNTSEDTLASADDLYFYVQMDNLEKQKDKLRSNIKKNSNTIKALFKELE